LFFKLRLKLIDKVIRQLLDNQVQQLVLQEIQNQ
jgi:hypothetical protein